MIVQKMILFVSLEKIQRQSDAISSITLHNHSLEEKLQSSSRATITFLSSFLDTLHDASKIERSVQNNISSI